ncbi:MULTISPECIES: hypothetical protein [Actinosynnema]|uniref:hypothetical protein n=1 Tax=Actinosynnema TaxID=40566 RepID=UPI0020A2BD39|nr:hypothetical protein [Actinosynnema pretiosum]MCP2092596.1 hypothetical protein [Actinosynnema pretiosum]
MTDTRSDYLDVLAREARALAPRLFAIAYEYGDGEDGEIAAYGLQFADHADAVGVEDNHRTRAESAEGVRDLYGCFALDDDITTHVLWLDRTESELARSSDISAVLGETG